MGHLKPLDSSFQSLNPLVVYEANTGHTGPTDLFNPHSTMMFAPHARQPCHCHLTCEPLFRTNMDVKE